MIVLTHSHHEILQSVCTRRSHMAHSIVVAMQEQDQSVVVVSEKVKVEVERHKWPLLQIQGPLNGLNRGATEHAL